MAKTARSDKTSHDQVFKTVIQEFFKEFMEMFLPAEAKRIDFRKVEFLDKEHFTDLVKGRKRVLDLVAKVGAARRRRGVRPDPYRIRVAEAG